MDERITLAKPSSLNSALSSADVWKSWRSKASTPSGALVFPSGLAILIAIFSELNIQCMTLAGGVRYAKAWKVMACCISSLSRTSRSRIAA
ncbi:hypothetical protein MJ579_01380 [Klebsiella pneumoniae]|nr:hypothetical protein MJ579_01380 [Klebsiella pneumoniae]